MSNTNEARMPGQYPEAAAGDLAASCTQRVEAYLAAASRRSTDAELFATLIAARDVRGELRLLGLGNEQLDALCERQFGPGWVARISLERYDAAPLPAVHAAFVHALHDLLLRAQGPAVLAADTDSVATIIAHACLRPDHLWRDLGLSGRDDVTRLLGRYFPTVMARNVNNLRWKKFLSFEVAAATGHQPGPAPGCPGCEDFGLCFPRSGA